jgi:hypothetical protein
MEPTSDASGNVTKLLPTNKIAPCNRAIDVKSLIDSTRYLWECDKALTNESLLETELLMSNLSSTEPLIATELSSTKCGGGDQFAIRSFLMAC